MSGSAIAAFLVAFIVIEFLFYRWGAWLAQRRGRSRSLGWLAVLLAWAGILVIYLLPDLSGVSDRHL